MSLSNELNIFANPEAFQKPSLALPLWRYMSFTKFLTILEHRALFFPMADTLNDRYEGVSYTKDSITKLRVLEEFLEKLGGSPKGVSKSAELRTEVEKYIRHFIAISSWHQSNTESYAMWQVYVPSGEGVCIKTNFDRFRECFSRQKDFSVNLGAVQYGGEIPALGDYLKGFLRKRPEFAYEQEVRAVVDLYAIYGDSTESWGDPIFSKARLDGGISVQVDTERLIEMIVVCPGQKAWLVDLVERNVERAGLSKDLIRNSVLD